MKKRSLLFLLMFLLLFSLPASAATKTKKIKEGQKTLSLTVGSKVQLKVKGVSKTKWTAKTTSYFKITKKGLLTAKRAGSAKLKYKIGSKKYTVLLKIKRKTSGSSGSSSGSSGSSSGSGGGTVYWVPNGEVYHSTPGCRSLSRSNTILSGPLASCPKSRPCKNCH